jgi:hypothetical protein
MAHHHCPGGPHGGAADDRTRTRRSGWARLRRRHRRPETLCKIVKRRGLHRPDTPALPIRRRGLHRPMFQVWRRTAAQLSERGGHRAGIVVALIFASGRPRIGRHEASVSYTIMGRHMPTAERATIRRGPDIAVKESNERPRPGARHDRTMPYADNTALVKRRLRREI